MYSSVVLLMFALALRGYASKNVPKGDYKCTTLVVEVPVNNVTVVEPPFPPFKNGYEATAFANFITIRTPHLPEVNLTTLTETYNISADYCTPAHPGHRAQTLHILSHGLGFNRSYWDYYLPSDPNNAQYSYVNSITNAGYSTLSYNRLGIYPSSIPDPYQYIQTLVELALLAGLTTLVRTNSIAGIPAPQRVIHVGHSFGSQLTQALAAAAPGLTDGIVLTGYSALAEYQPLFLASSSFHIAAENQPRRFNNSDYNSTGFVTWPTKYSNQYSFLQYPFFDPLVLENAEATKYPWTIGELLSSPALPFSAAAFNGPVLYVAAETDLIFCGSNCTGLFGPDSPAVQAFNGSSSVETYIQPNVGHGINLHYNATGAYDVIIDWAERHGFGETKLAEKKRS